MSRRKTPWLKSRLLISLIAASSLTTLSTNALAAEEVNVYSYRQPFLTDPLFDAVTANTGIKVNTVFAKQGLLERLENEGRNSPADLLLVTNVGRLDGAVQAGVTQAVVSEKLNDNIPDIYRDPDGHWFGLTNRARIIVTAKERVADGVVESYEDLAKPELKGRICTRSGKHEYMVELIASIVAHHGETKANEWLSGVKSNLARKPQGNDRAQVKAIAEGQCDVAVINSYYMGAMLSDPEQAGPAKTVNIVFPNQADRGTHMNISGVIMTSAAPNKDNALKLMEYLASDEAQAIYAERNHEFPVKPSVERSELVSSWGEFKADALSLIEVAKHRATASKLVDTVNYDG